MEDIVMYIIVFGLIFGGVGIWQLRSSNPRPYLLSIQKFPQLTLSLSIEKLKGKTKELLIKTDFHEKIGIGNPKIELINAKRETLIIDLVESLNQNGLVKNIDENQVHYKLDFEDFSKSIKENEFKFRTFRIYVENIDGVKFKSHELAFNKQWVIFRPDSGKYN